MVRSRGIGPWRVHDVAVTVEPGGRLFAADSLLGYRHLPGTFQITLGDGYAFGVTHGPDGHRITGPRTGGPGERPGIWIFGCSFTHGWSVEDSETYPWLLQERFPSHEVVNFGASGYSTVHSLLQFRRALAERRPRVAVLAYADFHDARNTFARARRKQVAPWNHLGPLSQPFACLDADGRLRIETAKVVYRPFPLQERLALVHAGEIAYNRFEARRGNSNEVSRALIAEMTRLADAHEVPLVIAAIHGGRRMLRHARENGLPAVEIAVDMNIPANTNLPHDGHPSARAHRHYADVLESFLLEKVLTADVHVQAYTGDLRARAP
ncbi:MAG: SGNH/GDSL hydrolase family protein [Candidatus Krumholzibacteriia bacterium]